MGNLTSGEGYFSGTCDESAGPVVTDGREEIYVVHVPLHRIGMWLVGDRIATDSSTTRLLLSVAYVAAVFAASCLAALGTWHLIESPFLSLKRFVPSGGAPVATRATSQVPAP